MFRCLGVWGSGVQVYRVSGFGFWVWGLGFRVCSGVQGWMKMVWDESVIGRNRFGMKVSLDEPVFG